MNLALSRLAPLPHNVSDLTVLLAAADAAEHNVEDEGYNYAFMCFTSIISFRDRCSELFCQILPFVSSCQLVHHRPPPRNAWLVDRVRSPRTRTSYAVDVFRLFSDPERIRSTTTYMANLNWTLDARTDWWKIEMCVKRSGKWIYTHICSCIPNNTLLWSRDRDRAHSIQSYLLCGDY